MAKILNNIVILLFWGVIYFILHIVVSRFIAIPMLDAVFFGLLVVLCLYSFIYKKQWLLALLRSGKGKISLGLAAITMLAVGTYVHFLTVRSYSLYQYFMSDEVKIIHPIFQSDPELGYNSIPNARAYSVVYPGDTVPFFYDRDGFRIPVSDTMRVNKPGEIDAMFFGCSFTFGDACYADSTFAHLASTQLGLRYMNAGVNSWGLSQMYLQAKKLIPKYKPKYVFFQYSYWLPERALDLYKESMTQQIPKPIFVKDKNGRFTLQKPLYASRIFELNRDSMRQYYRGHFIQFLISEGIPFYSNDDLLRLKMKLSIATGKLEPVANNQQNQTELSRQVYKELADFAHSYQAKPFILYLKPGFEDYRGMDSVVLSSFDSTMIVNSLAYHKDYVQANPGSHLYRSFVHWRIKNGDSVRIDIHPNNLSHRLIAKSLTDAISRDQSSTK